MSTFNDRIVGSDGILWWSSIQVQATIYCLCVRACVRACVACVRVYVQLLCLILLILRVILVTRKPLPIITADIAHCSIFYNVTRAKLFPVRHKSTIFQTAVTHCLQ